MIRKCVTLDDQFLKGRLFTKRKSSGVFFFSPPASSRRCSNNYQKPFGNDH